jgi:hypothetical protein
MVELTTENIVIIVCVVGILFLIKKCSKDGFTLSRKPFEEDNSLFLNNPFDNIDYQTPVFEKI